MGKDYSISGVYAEAKHQWATAGDAIGVPWISLNALLQKSLEKPIRIGVQLPWQYPDDNDPLR